MDSDPKTTDNNNPETYETKQTTNKPNIPIPHTLM